MQEIDGFSLFQFDVDNAGTIERSVSLLLSKLPTHSSWVLNYLYQSPQSTIVREFMHTFICQAKTESIPQLKEFLAASAIPFSTRFLFAAPQIIEVLIEWYQEPPSQSFIQDE